MAASIHVSSETEVKSVGNLHPEFSPASVTLPFTRSPFYFGLAAFVLQLNITDIRALYFTPVLFTYVPTFSIHSTASQTYLYDEK